MIFAGKGESETEKLEAGTGLPQGSRTLIPHTRCRISKGIMNDL